MAAICRRGDVHLLPRVRWSLRRAALITLAGLTLVVAGPSGPATATGRASSELGSTGATAVGAARRALAASVNAAPTQAWTQRVTYGSYPPSAAYPVFPMSSPAVGDVTGDGRPDAVVGGMDGFLRVYDASSGALETQYPLEGPIQSSPVLVDLYGTGRPQVLVSSASTSPGASSAVTVLSFSGTTATVRFRQTSTHPAVSPIYNHMQPFLATPTYGDIDGDGQPEIVAVNTDQHLYAWRLDGRQVFAPVFLYDTLLSSPVVVDWNFDGKGEIVFGGDMGPYQPYPNARGLLWSVDGTGAVSPGYPIQVPDQVVWAAPTVTDLNGDGRWDVVFGTGMNYPGDGGSEVYAYDLATRVALPGFPAPTWGRTYSTPVVADVDGNGTRTVIVGTGRGWLYAYDAAGHLRWQQCTTRFTPCTQNGQPGADFLQVNPAVADIDGDGRPEVVVSTEKDLKVYDAATGTPENVVLQNGERDGPVTVANAYANAATPSIADIGGHTRIFLDGLEAVGAFSPKAGDNGFLQAWDTPQALGAAPWPTDKGGYSRRGVVGTVVDPRPALRSFVAAATADFLGRPATSGELDLLSTALASGTQTKAGYLQTMVTSDQWLAGVITAFYRQTLGRDPDAGGLAYWTEVLRSGQLPVAQVAANFYASDEYFANKGGGTVSSWLDNLYSVLLNRPSDPSGLGYWSGLVATLGRPAVAYAFYQSPESCAERVDALFQKLLGRPADSGGKAYWSSVLPVQGDLALALQLGASAEYAARAVTRFPNA